MKFKKMMAFEVVKTIKGEGRAAEAQKEWKRVFQDGKRPSEMKSVEIKVVSPSTLVEIGAAPSKSQAKRLIEQRGVSINDEKKKDWKKKDRVEKGDVIQVGPRRFFEVL